MQAVSTTIFFETLSDNGAIHTFEKIDDVIVHVVSSDKDTLIIPIFENEDIPGDAVAIYLSDVGMLDLLPFLVPDHPVAEFAKTLTRRK